MEFRFTNIALQTTPQKVLEISVNTENFNGYLQQMGKEERGWALDRGLPEEVIFATASFYNI